jgi:hypothetical protein
MCFVSHCTTYAVVRIDDDHTVQDVQQHLPLRRSTRYLPRIGTQGLICSTPSCIELHVSIAISWTAVPGFPNIGIYCLIHNEKER